MKYLDCKSYHFIVALGIVVRIPDGNVVSFVTPSCTWLDAHRKSRPARKLNLDQDENQWSSVVVVVHLRRRPIPQWSVGVWLRIGPFVSTLDGHCKMRLLCNR